MRDFRGTCFCCSHKRRLRNARYCSTYHTSQSSTHKRIAKEMLHAIRLRLSVTLLYTTLEEFDSDFNVCGMVGMRCVYRRERYRRRKSVVTITKKRRDSPAKSRVTINAAATWQFHEPKRVPVASADLYFNDARGSLYASSYGEKGRPRYGVFERHSLLVSSQPCREVPSHARKLYPRIRTNTQERPCEASITYLQGGLQALSSGFYEMILLCKPRMCHMFLCANHN